MTTHGLTLGQGFCHGLSNNNFDNITNKNITIRNLEYFIKKVNTNKSSAVPNIKTRVLIHAYRCQAERVVSMYNGSLTQCTFLNAWKRATIVPLPKVSNPKTVSDMRPISLLPFPGKVMEMIVSQRLKAMSV